MEVCQKWVIRDPDVLRDGRTVAMVAANPECAKYKMTKDTHPGGQAYRVMANHRPEPPN